MAREFKLGERGICVANVDGTMRAVANECPHRGGPLGQGHIERGRVVCPWHGWTFDLTTGEATHFPKAKVDVYELRTEGDDVFISI